MNLREKAKVATVYYRAYPAHRSGMAVVVLEYWFYYVRDEYRVRGNILPVWMGGNHPNDLEHVHLVLRRDAAGSFVVDEILASAHEGKNSCESIQIDGAGHDGPTHLIVELGSHALAPDIDEDGIFTPTIDGDSGSKLQWGIRDRGYTWMRYRSSYMNPRTRRESPSRKKLRPRRPKRTASGRRREDPTGLPLSIHLNAEFARLKLTDKERKKTFEAPLLVPRVFGRNNGRSKHC
jgi:hypothetical protein